MSEDIETRILQRFESRLERTPEVSQRTIRALLDGNSDEDFGSDADLLETIVELD